MRDWNRRHCARRGHDTYEPVGDGMETRLRNRLRTETALGEAWRCLRCGDFVLGDPRHSGPADHAPVVLRGRALRDLFILRVLAVERIVRGVVIFAIAYAVWRFGTNKDALKQLFEQDITLFKPVAQHWGYDLDHATVIDRLRHWFGYQKSTLHYAALALGAYALLETVEGVGLWLAKRWGEYLTAVGTSIFLPLEIWDGYSKFHEHKSVVLACTTFGINIAAVLYLLVTKRLFGIRGGGEAFEAKKHADSLLTVEIAACDFPAARQGADSNGAADAAGAADGVAVTQNTPTAGVGTAEAGVDGSGSAGGPGGGESPAEAGTPA
jgi:uncharacterized membrane protein (DUF2068 family)